MVKTEQTVNIKHASPSVRKLARELGCNLDKINGKYDWIWACSTETSRGLKIPITDLRMRRNIINLKECVEFAESSPFPDPEDLYKDVYDGPYNFITD